ncbi:MAG: hypothetical protein L6263_00410 [Desulfobacteraceae bacterium]|nr:hypothetical protein [Desulfobacteraceae bacterium]
MYLEPDGGSYYCLGFLPEIDSAVGDESGVLKKSFENSIDHFMVPISRQWADPATRFFRLKQEWEEVTAMLSSITEIAMHPAYQQIIGMGSIAIPFIMRELENRPAHWFWALKSITGEDPVPPEKRGRIGDMTKAWLSWGREHDYIR